MKKIILDFVHRGLVASGFTPLVLVVIYLILKHQTDLQVLPVNEVCLGMVSLSLLAFVAGGMNVVYQIERLPLMTAVLIHGIVLYISYLFTYLVNDWLEWGATPIIVFTAVFVLGYVVIWAGIYSMTRRKTEKLNECLKKKQQIQDGMI